MPYFRLVQLFFLLRSGCISLLLAQKKRSLRFGFTFRDRFHFSVFPVARFLPTLLKFVIRQINKISHHDINLKLTRFELTALCCFSVNIF